MKREELDTNATYFVLMEPTDFTPALLGLPIVIVGGNNDWYWVECKLEPYVFDGFDFKLKAVPVNPIPPEYHNKFYFSSRTFYTDDFIQLLECGNILKKENPDDFVEHHSEKEYIPSTNGIYIVHEYDIVKRGGVL